jgi:hypothetical protein
MTPLEVYTGTDAPVVASKDIDPLMTALINNRDELELHRLRPQIGIKQIRVIQFLFNANNNLNSDIHPNVDLYTNPNINSQL